MMPSSTGLSLTAVAGSRLDQAGTKSALRGGLSAASGTFTAEFHPSEMFCPPNLLASPEKVEIKGRELMTK